MSSVVVTLYSPEGTRLSKFCNYSTSKYAIEQLSKDVLSSSSIGWNRDVIAVVTISRIETVPGKGFFSSKKTEEITESVTGPAKDIKKMLLDFFPPRFPCEDNGSLRRLKKHHSSSNT